MDRRSLLTGLALLPVFGGCGDVSAPSVPNGSWFGASPQSGHRMRDERRPALPTQDALSTNVLVVGGGIGGLSAAWWLRVHGIDDVLICELESETGGNSRSAGNTYSCFPLGAHYLPLPTQESRTLRTLLAELGAIEGDPYAARPRYAEALLCAAPQERLFRFGHWQEGLVPEVGLTEGERQQIQGFFSKMSSFRGQRATGKAFSLPMALGERSPEVMALDQLSFAEWLSREGFDCAPLRWYTDYACRDDFGAGADEVSAWAGVHYFASRDGEAEGAANDVVLTTPGGNGWIAEGLAGLIGDQVKTNTAVRHLRETRAGYEALMEDATTGATRIVRARAVVWAAPLFLAARLIDDLPDVARRYARAIDYAPWVMAQLSVARSPREAPGAPRAWDNVVYGSRSLGFVVASHQTLSAAEAPSVWT